MALELVGMNPEATPDPPHATANRSSDPTATPSRDRRTSRAGDRAAIVLGTAIYAFSIYFSYVRYMVPQWEYLGFTFRPPGLTEVVVIAILLACVASVLPARLTHASAVVLLLLYLFVYVPGVVITFCVDTDRIERYLPLGSALAAAFVLASWVSARGPQARRRRAVTPSRNLVAGFVAAWLLMCTLLVAEYRDIMTFVSLEDVYGQREAGASTNALIAYVHTYFSGVVTPALIALALVYRRPLLLILGIAGCAVMYAINAQKIMLFLPLAMIALHAMVTSRFRPLRSAAFPLFALSGLTWYAASRWQDDIVAGALGLFFVNRTIGIPGLTFSQYFDLFSRDGFTFWSHVKGVDLLVDIPMAFARDPLWPGLGYILGDRLFGRPEVNMNANLFSGDGVAAAGAVGVLLIGVVFAGFLWLLDRACRRWDQRFAMLAVMPMAIALTNGHLFTVLLSFGGFLWLLIFALAGRRRERAVASANNAQHAALHA
jgi:hypothetical protein